MWEDTQYPMLDTEAWIGSLLSEIRPRSRAAGSQWYLFAAVCEAYSCEAERPGQKLVEPRFQRELPPEFSEQHLELLGADSGVLAASSVVFGAEDGAANRVDALSGFALHLDDLQQSQRPPSLRKFEQQQLRLPSVP